MGHSDSGWALIEVRVGSSNEALLTGREPLDSRELWRPIDPVNSLTFFTPNSARYVLSLSSYDSVLAYRLLRLFSICRLVNPFLGEGDSSCHLCFSSVDHCNHISKVLLLLVGFFLFNEGKWVG